ncbi:hypothetical protein A2Z33_05450 [Candidatus Gottesmanbacteria bacterium RBG_16_52_11]|uniref:Glycosyl transferase family 1 domain-containing protein n=1 Tax=Candidatus Gottesmanbacteria bacterium RBG_16_52_11 TaxID=1798374 RepID=A0A1F5YN88_9BACT|nr:MAG: hypothetical protein A2Z33_05450 [Candidatus Gottesmanbacteria bacterium RBG_16_52_11]
MKIAVDITPLESEHRGRGIGVYTKYLISSLVKYDKVNSYKFFTRKHSVPENIDLIHYPCFDPFFLTLPVVSPVPRVITVHDLIPVAYSRHFKRGVRGSAKWLVQKVLLRRSARIITDSRASEADIVRLTGIPANKIDVVYLAPTITAPSQAVPGNRNTGRAKFFLYVGDVNWNKNVPGILSAYASLKKRKAAVPHLVLAGRAFTESGLPETAFIRQLTEKLGITGDVRFPGYVSDAELADLYRSAVCLLMPSFAEGFGLPVLEAFAFGCPAIVSRTGSLNEIGGPAIRVDPGDPESIADAMMKMNSLSTGDRLNLKKQSARWVSQYTWEKTVAGTVASYEHACHAV